MSNDNIQDWMDWAAGITGAGEGDLLLTREEIEAGIDIAVQEMGTLHTDPSTIPGSATARPRGAFSNPNDLEAYLEGGSLLSYDGAGQLIPNPLVHILKTTVSSRAIPVYEVWVDDTTPILP